MEQHIEHNGKILRAVCRSNDVVEHRGTRVHIDEYTDLALFRVDGQCHALTNICPHQRYAVIAEGAVEQGRVTCPMHDWTFEICSGREIKNLGRIRRYDALERDGFVYVEDTSNDLPPWMNSLDDRAESQ